MDWFAIKLAISETSGLERDALHLLAGLGAHLLLVLLGRSWLGAWWPLFLILLLALGNEWFDLAHETWPEADRARQLIGGGKDLLTTLLLPVTLVLLARFAPRLFTRPERDPALERPGGDAEGAVAPDALEVADQPAVRD